jgi:hypothetical protein
MNEDWMSFYSTYMSLRLCLFRFEQHITKMLPIIAYTLFQPRSQATQCSPRHVSWYRWNLLRNCGLEVIDCPWSSGVHFRSEVPPKEIITGREVRRTCRPWNSPRSEITCSGNIPRTISMDALTVRAVTPSCWNHMVESSIPRRLSSGEKKFRNIQHNEQDSLHSRSPVSVFSQLLNSTTELTDHELSWVLCYDRRSAGQSVLV